ncbi:MAG TPA: LPXTG cell wall anchor domain-containing protein [Baekduia sp.]|nr:LPXTG cell wall anchor domain-containing protein [Baekduia sp.]
MPSVCRRIVVLLVVALMGVGGPVATVYAQGAGDQQYEDPLGNSDSGSSGSSGSGSSDNDNLQPLSPSPQTSGSDSPSSSGTTSGAAGTSATGTTTSSATAPTLPNTGLDTRVLLLAGAVLLLVGVGLRMRNAPERF